MLHQIHMKPQGIFVVKDKENAVAQIDNLCKKYNSKNADNNRQFMALFRAYCQETIDLLEKCFATEMQGASRCKRFVEKFTHTDNIDSKSRHYSSIRYVDAPSRHCTKCNPDKGLAFL